MFITNISFFNLRYLLIYRPFQFDQENYIEIFNESCILFTSNVILSFLNPTLDLGFRDNMGWLLIAISAINIFSNVLILGSNTVMGIFYNAKVRYELHNKEKEASQRMKNKEVFAKFYPSHMEKFNLIKDEIEAKEYCRDWLPQRNWLK